MKVRWIMTLIVDKKRDYIIKTFSRTKKKDYENYVLNAIWNKLNRLDVQPITQQYVKNQEGKTYLIDLYFPQLNIGIECDESHHIGNQDLDEIRTMTISEVLDRVEAGEGFQIIRIRAYESIESINKQIDVAVKRLKNLIIENKNFNSWVIQSAIEFRDSRNEISIRDQFRYKTVLEIAQVLGKDYLGIQRAFFRINETYYAWCPHLSVTQDGRVIYEGKNDWINLLSEDWETITETRVGKDSMTPISKQNKYPRVTFVKSKDSLGQLNYRFIGIYQFDDERSVQELRVYKRVGTGFSIR
jgi:very-short-patch-repair endonuclease